MNLSEIAWQLDILSRAVAHKNLTTAAAQIGMSQPQLSRVIRTLEESLGVELLDRESRRGSRWRAQASEVAEGYRRANSAFVSNMQGLLKENWPERVRILTLEGLKAEALKLANLVLSDKRVHRVEVDVLDLGPLEVQFNSGDCELILTSRAPSRRKLEREKLLGYQTMDEVKTRDTLVLSSFEDASKGPKFETRQKRAHKALPQAFISNSLALRRMWIDRYGGTARLPSPLRPAKRVASGQIPVLLIGADHPPEAFWKKVSEAFAG